MVSVSMTLQRFGELLEAHGPSLARWPEEERRSAERLLAENEAARALLAEHTALARLLDDAKPDPAATLERRILAATVERRQMPTAPALAPPRRWPMAAAALAASLVVGLALGLSGRFTPWSSPPVTQATLEADDELLALAWLGSPALDEAALQQEEGERP